jgi:hypothetical protein
MLRSRLVQAVIAVALLATPLFLFGDRALAVQDSEDKVLFGPVGIGVGEGARISVYTIGNPNEAPWAFVVRVFNRLGTVVQSGKFQVAPGAIGSFEIIGNPDERTGLAALAVRQTLRAEVVGFSPLPDSPGKYAATLEVYSLSNGRTSILIGNPDEIPAARGIVTVPQQNPVSTSAPRRQ